jgi:hypothetical protein
MGTPLKLLSIAKPVKKIIDSNMNNSRQLLINIKFLGFDA